VIALDRVFRIGSSVAVNRARIGVRVGRASSSALVALALTTLSGCSTLSEWGSWVPWFGKKETLLPELKNSTIGVQWSASAGNAKGFLFQPAVGDRVVFGAAHGGKITALDEQGGRSVSSIDAKSKLTSGVGVGDNFVAVGTTDGQVVAFDAAGRPLWKSPMDGELLAPPQVVQGIVLVRTADGRLYALNRADGKRRWVFTRTAPPLTLRSGAAVTVNRGVVYAGFPAGKVVAIEIESGRPVWEATISLPRGTTELERIADVAGPPVVDGARVCAAVYQGRTGCVETLSGNALWSRDISSADGVAMDEKNLYVADTDGNVFALDKTSGSTVWKQDKLAKRDLGTPILVKGRLIVADRAGFVHALAIDTGELTGRAPTDGSRVNALLAGATGAIAQTAKGGIYAVAVR
jgi:outer membrane protein assembly factor BamB